VSHKPSGLAVVVIGKKRKHKKSHACHLVGPWLPSGLPLGQNKRKNKKMSRTPSGLAVAVIGKKKKTQKMSRTPSGLVMAAIEPKKIEK
jgi:hypothetical protein